MKIMIHSNPPWVGSGYGKQTALLISAMQALGHEVAVSASWGLEGNAIDVGGVIHFPGKGAGDPYGVEAGPRNAEMWEADILWVLMDQWVYSPRVFQERGVRWVAHTPVDHEPAPTRVVNKVKDAFRVVAMSKFGRDALAQFDVQAEYLPHAFDEEVFRPIEDRRPGFFNLPEDKFVVGIMGANTGHHPRKNLPNMMLAARELQKEHDDVFVVIHTQMNERNEGYDLHRFAEEIGLDTGATDPNPNYRWSDPPTAVPDPLMAKFMAGLDVLLHVSMGEGFGVVALEAQACGTPVITGEWTSMKEVNKSGLTVPKKHASAFVTGQLAKQWVAGPEACLQPLRRAYNLWKAGRLESRRRTVASKVSAEYTTANLQMNLEVILEGIEQEIEGGSQSVEREG